MYYSRFLISTFVDYNCKFDVNHFISVKISHQVDWALLRGSSDLFLSCEPTEAFFLTKFSPTILTGKWISSTMFYIYVCFHGRMPLGVDCKGSALQVMRKGSQVVGLPPYGMTYGSVQDLCYKLQEQVKLQKVSNIIYNCQWNLTNVLPTARPTTRHSGADPGI